VRDTTAQRPAAPAEAVRDCVRLERQLHVPLDVRDGRPERRHPRVVDHDQPARAHQAGHEAEVDQDALEAMVAVVEGEVELSTLGHEPRQRELTLLLDDLDDLAHTGVAQCRQPRELPRALLEGIDRDMPTASPDHRLA
jgi:hypothetical protein